MHAIIYNHSNNTCSGHYISAVKYNETWFFVDAESISDVSFSSKINDLIEPYLLI